MKTDKKKFTNTLKEITEEQILKPEGRLKEGRPNSVVGSSTLPEEKVQRRQNVAGVNVGRITPGGVERGEKPDEDEPIQMQK